LGLSVRHYLPGAVREVKRDTKTGGKCGKRRVAEAFVFPAPRPEPPAIVAVLADRAAFG
jgi:hypothetical protein